MKIKPWVNDYGHKVADCPFCDNFVYLRESKLASPDPLRDLKRHITNEAKNEALESAVANKGAYDVGEYKHLEYYLKHTHEKVVTVRIPKKVQYDADLEIETE